MSLLYSLAARQEQVDFRKQHLHSVSQSSKLPLMPENSWHGQRDSQPRMPLDTMLSSSFKTLLTVNTFTSGVAPWSMMWVIVFMNGHSWWVDCRNTPFEIVPEWTCFNRSYFRHWYQRSLYWSNEVDQKARRGEYQRGWGWGRYCWEIHGSQHGMGSNG